MIDGGVDEAAALNRHLVCASRAGAKPERRQPKLPKPTAAFDRDDLIIHRTSSPPIVAVLPNVSDRSDWQID